jgi:hypothetical protein
MAGRTMGRQRDDRGRFAAKASKDSTPFNQADYEEPDTMPRTPDGRPDVAGVAAKRRRESTLHLHTNKTMERGLAILAGAGVLVTKSDATWAVVKMLKEAEPKYTKLGGKAPYWTEGVSQAGHRGGPK